MKHMEDGSMQSRNRSVPKAEFPLVRKCIKDCIQRMDLYNFLGVAKIQEMPPWTEYLAIRRFTITAIRRFTITAITTTMKKDWAIKAKLEDDCDQLCVTDETCDTEI